MLSFWIEFFEDLQNIRGRSQNTIMAYRRDLEVYEEFKNTKASTSAIYDFLKSKNFSARSQARLISSIRTYLKFCEQKGMTCGELRELRQPKLKNNLPKPITLEQFERLSKAAIGKDELYSSRNLITLNLLLGLGCRVSELIVLNLSDLNEIGRWIKVTGKGSKERLIPLTQHLMDQLSTYIRDVRSLLVKEQTDSLIVNDRGHRPSRVDIWRWLASWSARAGFSEPISPHQFRHGCATALLDSGADLRSIQLLLGHSSIQTTQIYTAVTSTQLRQTIDEFHPLGSGQKI
jgi:integrase/recombinase XerD